MSAIPSAIILLANHDVRVIRVGYEPDRGDAKNFRNLKTFDKSIKTGDLVAVATDTRHKLTVVKVEEVDVTVDFENGEPIGWAIQKIDMDRHNDLLSKEAELIRTVQSGQGRRLREQMTADLLKDNPGLTSLPLATMRQEGLDTIAGS